MENGGRHMRKTGNETGYTMLETIMYISLLGVLGVVLAGYVGTVFKRYKTGRLTQQIIDVKKTIINFTAADEDYRNLSVENVLKAEAMPLDMRNAYHAMGGKIDFGPVGAGIDATTINDKYLFYVTFESINRAACVELLAQGQFYGDGSDMDTLIVNNKTAWNYERSFYDASDIATVYTMVPKSNAAIGIRPKVEEIVKACSEKENNKITWIFS